MSTLRSYTWYQRRTRAYNALTGRNYSAKSIYTRAKAAAERGEPYHLQQTLERLPSIRSGAQLERYVSSPRGQEEGEKALLARWEGYAHKSPAAMRIKNAAPPSYVGTYRHGNNITAYTATYDAQRRVWIVVDDKGVREQASKPAKALPATYANKERILEELARTAADARRAEATAYGYQE